MPSTCGLSGGVVQVPALCKASWRVPAPAQVPAAEVCKATATIPNFRVATSPCRSGPSHSSASSRSSDTDSCRRPGTRPNPGRTIALWNFSKGRVSLHVQIPIASSEQKARKAEEAIDGGVGLRREIAEGVVDAVIGNGRYVGLGIVDGQIAHRAEVVGQRRVDVARRLWNS